jgi:hypothetical protein
MKIMNLNGQELVHKKMAVTIGANRFQESCIELNAGLYFMQITDADGVRSSQKLIKQ